MNDKEILVSRRVGLSLSADFLRAKGKQHAIMSYSPD
jgi:hypothetical protein